MTKRLVHAMRQPYFKIWGHALGRLVLRREPIEVRLDEVLDAIAESRAAIEINGDPHRLDLDPVNARKAAGSRHQVHPVERRALVARARCGALRGRHGAPRADPQVAGAQRAAHRRARGGDPADRVMPARKMSARDVAPWSS